MGSFLRSFGVFIYEFLISLKLAVILIVLLMISLAAGTILESLHGASTAKLIIYNAPFFTVLLILLGANVLTVAISRWPWQKKHIGFLMTHAGIILILAGSLMTRYSMIDGQMVLTEGERGSVVTLPDQRIEIQKIGSRKAWTYPVAQKPFPWEGHEKMGQPGKLPVELSLLNYYPKAVAKQVMQSAPQGPAAVKIRLHNAMADETFWLREADPVEGVRDMGPAEVLFSEKALEQKNADEKTALSLEIMAGDQKWTIPFSSDQTTPFEQNLEGSEYKVSVQKLFKNAGVVGRDLIEQGAAAGGSDWRNPAVVVMLTGNGTEETRTLFSNFPDFSSIHGQTTQTSPNAVKMIFYAPEAAPTVKPYTLNFFKRDGILMYQVKSNDTFAEREAKPGEDNPVGWMGFSFSLEEYLPHAQKTDEYEPRSNTSTDNQAGTAIRIGLKEGQSQSEVWMMEGETVHVSVGQNVYQLAFGRKQKPLGFSLELKDFKKVTYPGTNKPASFSSDVVMNDATRGVTREVTISMNEPLEYKGYKIYQSAYRSLPGQPEISIFAIGWDPGIPLNYTGAIVLVSGIIVMILMQARKKRKAVKS